MKTHFIMFAAMLFCAVPLSAAHAEENIFAGYYADTQKPADAKTNNIYGAWANNNANLIIHKNKPGVVIDGEGDYANGSVHADGAGNVVVDRNAKINGPIINQTELKNTTVIINKNSSNRRIY